MNWQEFFKDVLTVAIQAMMRKRPPKVHPTPPHPIPIPTPGPVQPTPAPIPAPGFLQAVLDQTNAMRAQVGRPALTLNSELTQAALGHSQWMARTGRLDHYENGATPWDRIQAQGYQYRAAAENILDGDPRALPDITSMMRAWRNSPAHYANIINPDVTEMGFGLATAAQGGTIFATCDFAAPLRSGEVLGDSIRTMFLSGPLHVAI